MDPTFADRSDKLASRKTHLTEGEKISEDLADETGGRAFFPYHVDDLDQSFQDIGDELRNQYSIADMPTTTCSMGVTTGFASRCLNTRGISPRAPRLFCAGEWRKQ